MSAIPKAASPKAESVDAQGARDGFEPLPRFRREVVGPGHTRLAVSAPPAQLPAIHKALVALLDPPLRVLYQRLTDRQKGQLDKPEQHVGLEVSMATALAALDACAPLVYHDGRHQIWVQSREDAKVVLEETGVVFCYPDDPSFRDVLEAHGVVEGAEPNLGDRDYVRVNFLVEGDALEKDLVRLLKLQRWERTQAR